MNGFDSATVSASEHSTRTSVLLHVIPGLVATAIYLFAAQREAGQEASVIYSIFPAIMFGILPIELGILAYLGLDRNERLSFDGIILYRKRMGLVQLVVYTLNLAVWAAFCLLFLSPPIEQFLIRTVFAGLPSWLLPPATGLAEADPRRGTIIFGAAAFVVNGFVGPVVEEAYYRGFLLPRIERFGLWAPLISLLLYALSHLYTPWQIPGRILAFLPLVYMTWLQQNVYLPMYVQVLVSVLISVFVGIVG